jgi:TonB family protein
MDQTDKQKYLQNHIWGIAGTVLFHGLLLFIFITIVFHTPIPPWPEEGGGGGGSGLEINLGNSNEGMGSDQYAQVSIPNFQNRKAAEPILPPVQEAVKSKNTQAENILTQETEESVSVPSKPENPKKKTDKSAVVKQAAQPVVVAQPVVNQNALYRKNKNTNDGTTGKPGNQGREDGKTGSGNYGGTGTGKGTGNGSGTGSGSGSGSGSGIGSGFGGGVGSGTSYDLSGRSARNLPKPEYNSLEQGRVVVSIWVNKSGQVVKALAGAKGTTISDASLRKLAENAARRATFSPDQDAAEEQRGTITYVFVKLK